MNIYSVKAKDIKGNEVDFEKYKGKILLIVNTASECAYTHQYEGLQRIYEYFEQDDLLILAFPCNQFGAQEPCDNNEILSFVQTHFGVDFPIFEKIDVNGPNEHELYKILKKEFPGDIEWNFEKFLVDKDGSICGRYKSSVEPRELVEDINELI